VSSPIKTLDGFEVIRRENLPPTFIPPFESVKAQVQSAVLAQKLESLVNQKLARTRVDIDEDLLKRLDLTH
jgi:parvulin-like peptidyl-prolyl isomerase